MCSQSEEPIMEKRGPKVEFKFVNGAVQCKKCDIRAYVLLQRKDAFCCNCFYDYCSHKFRSAIGKSKLVKQNERILIAFSGGMSSAAMTDMVIDGLSAEEHRKLLFIPSVIHIDEGIVLNETLEERRKWYENISQLMLSYGLTCYITSIEMAFRNDENCQFYYKLNSNDSVIPFECSKSREKFCASFSHVKSLTAKEEFIRLMRYRLITEIAKREGYDKIFMGNAASLLAIQMITDVAQGKGCQIHAETSFGDFRRDVTILKPMREFVIKEIAFYNVMRRVKYLTRPSLTTKLNTKSSINKLTESFVIGLQNDYPATVYTIFKTGNKLKSYENARVEKCVMCDTPLDTINRPKCSAFSALNLTNILSKKLENEIISKGDDLPLCYGCTILANEMKLTGDMIPEHFYNKSIKHQIQDFLIEDDD